MKASIYHLTDSNFVLELIVIKKRYDKGYEGVSRCAFSIQREEAGG